MPVLLLRVARQRHAAPEEGEVPHVGPDHARAGVHAEDLHAGEGRDHPDPEAEHVRDRGDGDGDRGLAVGLPQPHRHRVVHGGAPPGRQHHEGVVYPDAEHEEGRREVDADEVHAEVHDEAEGGDGAEDGGEDAEQPEQGLGLDPVRHHAGEDAEDDHDADVEGEVRDHGVGVLLQLLLQGDGREAGHVQVRQLLHLDRLEEGVLPQQPALLHPLLLGVEEVSEADRGHLVDGVDLTQLDAAEEHRELERLEGVGVEPEGVGQAHVPGLDHLHEVAQVQDLVDPAETVEVPGAELLVVEGVVLPLDGDVPHDLVEEHNLAPHLRPQQRLAVRGRDEEPREPAGPRAAGGVVLAEVGGEVVLEDVPLQLGLARVGAEQELWVRHMFDSLEAGGAERGDQQRHDQEISGMVADKLPEPVEGALEKLVHNIQLAAHHSDGGRGGAGNLYGAALAADTCHFHRTICPCLLGW